MFKHFADALMLETIFRQWLARLPSILHMNALDEDLQREFFVKSLKGAVAQRKYDRERGHA